MSADLNGSGALPRQSLSLLTGRFSLALWDDLRNTPLLFVCGRNNNSNYSAGCVKHGGLTIRPRNCVDVWRKSVDFSLIY